MGTSPLALLSLTYQYPSTPNPISSLSKNADPSASFIFYSYFCIILTSVSPFSHSMGILWLLWLFSRRSLLSMDKVTALQLFSQLLQCTQFSSNQLLLWNSLVFRTCTLELNQLQNHLLQLLHHQNHSLRVQQPQLRHMSGLYSLRCHQLVPAVQRLNPVSITREYLLTWKLRKFAVYFKTVL